MCATLALHDCMRTDYYQLLEIGQKATAAEIKVAYRHLAKRYHPDLNVGNPAAEERFKLVAEAYRTLGEPERRADYDAWLERQSRLSNAPELAAMAARRGVRVSVRRAYERRENRGRHRRREGVRGAHVPHLFALRSRGDSGGFVHFVVFYSLCLAIMVPWFISYAGREAPPTVYDGPRRSNKLPGESDLPPEVQERELRNFHARISQAAEAGEPWAQFRYGMMLYNGYQNMEQNREAAMQWWQKAAEGGHVQAARMLEAARKSQAQPQKEAEKN